MKQTSFTTIILKADDGCYLTQRDATVEAKDRIIATEIALGKYDSLENWMEISANSAESIKMEQEIIRNREENERDTK